MLLHKASPTLEGSCKALRTPVTTKNTGFTGGFTRVYRKYKNLQGFRGCGNPDT